MFAEKMNRLDKLKMINEKIQELLRSENYDREMVAFLKELWELEFAEYEQYEKEHPYIPSFS